MSSDPQRIGEPYNPSPLFSQRSKSVSLLSRTRRMRSSWHVLDDGKRTLIFDAPGRVQISLNLREIRDVGAFLEQLAEEHRSQQAQIEAHVVQIERYPALMMRGLSVNDEQLEQIFLVHPDGCDVDGLMLVARVTTKSDDMRDTLELVDGILRSVKAPSAMAR